MVRRIVSIVGIILFLIPSFVYSPDDGHNRRWPGEIEMAQEIKELVSKKAGILGIGNLGT